MKFYEWLHEYGQDPNVNIGVDTEYYMIKAWNAALLSCLTELEVFIPKGSAIIEKLNALKQSEEVF